MLNIKDKTILVVDTEANGLDPTEAWCICSTDLQTGEKKEFEPEDLHKFDKYQKNFDYIVGHNILGYDRPKVFKKLLGIDLPLGRCLDTYVMSKLSNPSKKVLNPFDGKIISGHSIKAYGLVYGLYKHEHEDWSQFTYDMLQRCRRDTDIGVMVFKDLLKDLKDFSHFSIMLEHRVAEEIREMMNNGVYFDIQGASLLRAELHEKAEVIKAEVLQEFKPKPIPVREYEPRYNKDGSLSIANMKWYSDDPEIVNRDIAGPVTKIAWQEFDLGSPKQVVKRMNEIGWKPVERTLGAQQAIKDFSKKKITKEERDKKLEFGWKVSEVNLETLPEDAPQCAHKLRTWKMLSSRVSTLDSWLGCVNPDTSYIHGYIDSLGAVTTRMTHDSPNTANIVSAKKEYGKEIRRFWTVDDPINYCLVGEDADALEMRMFADLVNDEQLIFAVEQGNSDEGTDPHTLHSKLLEFDREKSKTWFYAFIYGATPPKLASISGRSVMEEEKYISLFLRRYPGLKIALEKAQSEFKRYGKIEGIDGRWYNVRSPHAVLNTKLQGNGAVACKLWMVTHKNYIVKNKLDSKLNLNVHDELQWRTLTSHAEEVGELGKLALENAGKRLKLNIKLKANYKIGLSWADTH